MKLIDGRAALESLGRTAAVGAMLVAFLWPAAVLGGRAGLSCAEGGVIALELAGSADTAQKLTMNCSAGAVSSALAWDVPLVVLYMAVLSLVAGTSGLADRLSKVPSGRTPPSRWWWLPLAIGPRCFRVTALRDASKPVFLAALGAGAADLVEDVALRLLAGGGFRSDAWAVTASTVSWVKWLLLAVVLAYCAVALGGFVVTPIWLQRQLFKPPQDERTPAQAKDAASGPEVAIALSGGGIRSASFGLGGLQALEVDRPDLGSAGLKWGAARQVAAISGGSYTAAALAIARQVSLPADGAVPPVVPSAAFPDAWSPGSSEERTLVLRLGYLLAAEPRGVQVRSVSQTPSDPQHVDGEAAPNPPAKDAPGVLSTLFAGLVVNAAVLLVLLWLLARPAGWLVASRAVQPGLALPVNSDYRRLVLRPALYMPGIFFGALAAALFAVWVLSGRLRHVFLVAGFASWLHRTIRPAVAVAAGIAAATTLLLVVLPAGVYVFPRLVNHTGGSAATTVLPAWLTGLGSVLSAIGLTAAVRAALADPLAKAAPRLGGLLLLAVGLVLFLMWASGAAVGGTDDAGWYGAAAVVAAVLYMLANPEWWSVAPFYRGRLRSAFATFRDPRHGGQVASWADGDTVRSTQATDGTVPGEPSLHELRGAAEIMPRLTVCASMTVSGRTVMTHYGIPAHRVTFESERVSVYVPHTDDGVYGVTECSTEDLETVSYRWDSPRLTTMLAVGASAAAASPAMGRKSLGTTNSLLAFANVRLGVWLPNPRFVAAMRAAKGPGAGDLLKRDPRSPARWLPYPRIRIGYLIKELFGLHDPTDLYVYVTDGGHWENTGLVDVLRGGVPAEVVCLDGSGNPVGRVTSIAEGIGLAHLECGLDVRLDLDPLREDPIKPRGQQYARRAVGLGVVLRPSSTTGTGRPQEAGLLWYVRPALTADTPSGILAFAERDANFPSTSTLDQFFDTEQFEAYRDLGRHVGYQVREARAHLLPALAAAQTLDDFRLAAADPAASWCLTALAALVGDEEYDVLRLRLPAS